MRRRTPDRGARRRTARPTSRRELRGRSPARGRRSARTRRPPACPSTSPLPSSSGTPSAGPTATTVLGANGASAARATGLDRPTIASSRGGARYRSSAQSAQPKAPGRDRASAPRAAGHRRAERVRARRRPRSGRDAGARTRASSCPDGIGLSSRPFVRATSSSPSRRREEEAAVLGVVEELDRERGEPVRLVQPAHVAGRDVELDQPVGDVRVVVEEAVAAHLPLAPRARQHAPSSPRQRAEQELADVDGRRASRRARAVARPRRARRARARSTRRSPCRRGPAAAAAARSASSRAASPASSSPRMIERPCSNGCSSPAGPALRPPSR